MITQPAHGIQIAHLTGVAGKPGGQPGALQIARGPAPQPQAGTPFASAPGGTQVKVLAPQGAGALLSDVLSQQSGTTLIPPGSVFIQATQHGKITSKTNHKHSSLLLECGFTARLV